MDRSVKAPGGSGDFDEMKPLIAVGAGFGLIEGAGASLRVGQAIYGGPAQEVSMHPVNLALGLATGQLDWTWAATGGAATLVAGLAGTALGSAWAWGRLCEKCADLKAGRKRPKGKKSKETIDARAKFMARGKDLVSLSARAIRAKAESLGVPLAAGDAPGVMIGRAAIDNAELYASYEDLHVDIWGPRQGKSTSRVIPAIMDAIGPVVSTSNKRDVVDATRALRGKRTGERTWVFDPQGIVGEAPSWYWDPVEWVWGVDGDGAEERAAALAGIFAASGDLSADDAFFATEGEDLLAGLILAAAVGARPITDVYTWVTDIKDKTPTNLLHKSGDFPRFAVGLSAQYSMTDKTRSGVFTTAKKMAAALRYSKLEKWVTPAGPGEPAREAFDVEAFLTAEAEAA